MKVAAETADWSSVSRFGGGILGKGRMVNMAALITDASAIALVAFSGNGVAEAVRKMREIRRMRLYGAIVVSFWY